MSCNKNIWVLENDPNYLFIYKKILNPHYNTMYFSTIAEFNMTLVNHGPRPDLIIADISLSDGCFLQMNVEDSIKNSHLHYPFIIVSLLNNVNIIRYCFEEGAIDYLAKPFQENEFFVKIERIIKAIDKHDILKPQKQNNDKMNNSNIIDYYEKKTKSILGKLTKKERLIMEFFIENSNKITNRNELTNHLWNKITVHPKTLDVHLYNLRKKIRAFNMDIISADYGGWQLQSPCKNKSTMVTIQ